jgi:hypothetical protein
MQLLMLLLMTVVVTFQYLGTLDWIPNAARYSFEVIAAVLLLYVLVVGVRDRFRFIRAEYLLVFLTLIVVVICGLVLNSVAPGPMFMGMRSYLRVAPLFALPAVLAFTDQQIKTQLKLLLALAVLQIPIAVLQRSATLAYGGVTGDLTSGTLIDSSFLSIYLIGGISFVTALRLRKLISVRTFIILFLLLVFPTAINETKATFLLLPLAFFVIYMVFAPPGMRLKNAVLAGGLVIMFAAIFVPIYDYLIQNRPGAPTLVDFFTNEKQVDSYLGKDAQLGITGSKSVGRVDSIIVPLKTLMKDPAHLVFGYGIGNVSFSTLGPEFVGQYFAVFQFFLQTTFTRLVLEIGLFGSCLVLLLYWMIFKDARIVAAHDQSFIGALALGWAGFTAVIVVANFYKELVGSDALSCLFWYYSGLIAAQRLRLASQEVRLANPGVRLDEGSRVPSTR